MSAILSAQYHTAQYLYPSVTTSMNTISLVEKDSSVDSLDKTDGWISGWMMRQAGKQAMRHAYRPTDRAR